jgi:hypothetical protein
LHRSRAFEGLDDRLDPLPHAAKRPEPARLTPAVGPDDGRAKPDHQPLKRAAGKALVAHDDTAKLPSTVQSDSSAAATWRSPSLGVARHQLTGIPSGAVSTYSLKPQYQRDWLLQQP